MYTCRHTCKHVFVCTLACMYKFLSFIKSFICKYAYVCMHASLGVAHTHGCSPPTSSPSPLHSALAGSLAAVVSSVVLCPTELVKCRLQAHTEMRTLGRTPLNAGRWVWRNNIDEVMCWWETVDNHPLSAPDSSTVDQFKSHFDRLLVLGSKHSRGTRELDNATQYLL